MPTFSVGSARPPTPEMFTGSIADKDVGEETTLPSLFTGQPWRKSPCAFTM